PDEDRRVIRLFPHKSAYLQRTRLRYVSLPNIMNDGKVTREGRVTGLVVLFFGEEQGWIFQVAGEAATAARLRPELRQIVPLGWVLKRAEQESERADVAYFGVSSAQLGAMYSTLAGEPTLPPSEAKAGPKALLAELQGKGFDGVVELRDGVAVHYLVLERGKLRDAFLAGRGEGEPLGAALERVFRPAAAGPLVATGYRRIEGIPAQAPRALGELYRQVIAGAVSEVGKTMGAAPAKACFADALERIKRDRAALRALGLGADGRVLGDATATAEELTDGMAAWLFEGLSAASHVSDVDPLDVYPRVIGSHRHALQAQGFLKRLPWPASI
ncbi:MAG: hypothetical protein ACRELV_14495, partial [Longimicrobiales bacterium]